jgi:hypothetical protein
MAGEGITVGFDPRELLSFQAAATALSDDRLRQALREALNAAGGKTRTQVRRALREQTNVKAAKDINDRTKSFIVAGELAYRIEAINKALPIDRVKGLTVQMGAGGGVYAAPWGVGREFKRSFVVNGRYLARLGHERFPVRALFGPSVMKELTKDQSRETFETFAVAELERQVVGKLQRFLAM